MSRALRIAGLLCLLAAPAAASEEAHASPGLFFPLLNFGLLVAALIYFVRKPAQAWFAQRRAGIESELREAAELRKQAEERHARWQRRLADLERELAEIRATSRERAETEREHILSDARSAAERIRREASSAIEQELRRARERLRDEAADLAVQLAEGLLRQQVTDADRARLLDEFIARVEESPASPTAPGAGRPA